MPAKGNLLPLIVLVLACDGASEPQARPASEAVIAAALHGSTEVLPGPIDLVLSSDSADAQLLDSVAASLGARVGRLRVECSGLDCTVDPPVRGYIEILDVRAVSGSTSIVTLTVARVTPGPGYARTDAYTVVQDAGRWRVEGVEEISES